jgi:hypothetical protein
MNKIAFVFVGLSLLSYPEPAVINNFFMLKKKLEKELSWC